LSTPTLLTQSSSEISHDKRLSLPSSTNISFPQKLKDPWRKSFKGKLPQSFDLFLEHFQPKIDVEIERDGNRWEKIYEKPARANYDRKHFERK